MQPWFTEFAEGVADGSASIDRCVDCDDIWLPPRTICPTCKGRELESTARPTAGIVESHTTITSSIPTFADETPYTIVYVRFDDGLALVGQWRGDDEVASGDPVTLGVQPVGEHLIFTFSPPAE